jgi:hypothetical protein
VADFTFDKAYTREGEEKKPKSRRKDGGKGKWKRWDGKTDGSGVEEDANEVAVEEQLKMKN